MEKLREELLAQAVQLFNDREFFPCHDVLEELWSETLGEERACLQGLIHAAVALFHFSEGNLAGARKMHDSALRYLSRYGESFAGIDLTRFRREFDECFQPLLGPWLEYPVGIQIDGSKIPQLHFTGTNCS